MSLFEGYGWRPLIVDGGLDEPPADAHAAVRRALDEALDDIRAIQERARTDGRTERPRWPMLILRTPKGWTGPREVDGLQVEGTWRSHQVPVGGAREDDGHRADPRGRGCAATGRKSCSTTTAGSCPELRALAPRRRAADEREPARERRRAAAGPRAAGLPRLRRRGRRAGHELDRGDARTRRVPARRDRQEPHDASGCSAPTRQRRTASATSSRSPTRAWDAETEPTDEGLAPDGRVMEVLSEHQCQGWLEGYLLTGRHGLFNCYEAFIHIVDSMFNQHAKWLKVTRDIPWRRPVASLNYLLSSHVWRQDHNGFSHQDPGFIDHVVNKKAEVIRVYLPPDANTPALGRRSLPAVAQLRQRDRRRQAACAQLPDDRRGDHPLHAAARASGSGPRPTRAASRTSSSAAAATSRRSRRSPPPHCCASTCRSSRCASSTSST